MAGLGDDELDLIFGRISDRKDRNSISQVCKQWLRVEGLNRLSVHVLEPEFLRKFLPRFPNLIKFELSTQVTNDDIDFVVRTCPKIEVLNLNFRQRYQYYDEFDENLELEDVNDVGLCSIAKGCPQLSKVLLRNRKGISNLGVISLVETLGYLSHLDLSGCNSVTDRALKAIGKVGSIRTLNLQGCSLITDEGLSWLLSGSLDKCLEKLVLAECDRITDFGVRLLQQMHCLQELNLADCGPKITDTGGLAIASILSLKRLNFSWLINVSDATIIEISRNCHNLVEIVITGCEGITGDGIRVFTEHKSLEVLEMASCYNVLMDDIRHLVFGCPSLKQIGLDRRLRAWIPSELQQNISTFCRLNWM
ncbi:hypothetical protein Nepgr_012637 [Nepenthes gracilis]|uniref:COI1 F-box domain-containing protein n=1 Tax=Nepenthes gracilis TaxID=150966 RepID=A0AAD3SHW0_NEPGR|nr:hypothetical protein Nepgr_012637 [Nepenthes gracilis]